MYYYSTLLKESESRVNFLKGLVRLSKADGRIDPAERNFIRVVATEMGLSLQDMVSVNGWIHSDEVLDIYFETDEEKLLFIREGIRLCAADHPYDDAERIEMRVIASSLQIPETVVEQFEDWAEVQDAVSQVR